MFKRIIALSLVVITLAFSFSSCGNGGVRVTAYKVTNSDFFEKCYRDFILNERVMTETNPYFPLANSFSVTFDDFIKIFLNRYESNFGLDLKILVANSSSSSVTVNGIRTEHNGYEDTYISSLIGFGDSVTLEPESKTELTIHFLGNGGIYTNEEMLDIVLREMDLKLSCTFEGESEEELIDVKIKPAE